MSLAIRIIPCLDVAGARVVKGVNFENLKDAGDPLELAGRYYQAGADELTFLDVNATVENRETMYELVKQTAQQVFIPLTVGGGVRTVDDVALLLAAGADKVSIASAALNNPSVIEQIASSFGSQVLVLSLDAKRGTSASGYIATQSGGRIATDIDAIEWVKRACGLGIGEVLINSIDADGTKQGFDTAMIDAVLKVSTVPVIASGGAGEIDHFVQVAGLGVDAILAASVFHNGTFTINQVKGALTEAGYEVREVANAN
ncbi:MAG: imidazole glycerol phosphate synthase subunit HisF [Actinomycetota bacterium]|jgi:cyclase